MPELLSFIVRRHNSLGANIKPGDVDFLMAVYTTSNGTGYYYSIGGEYYTYKNGCITRFSPVIV